jgi:hypothetical protein
MDKERILRLGEVVEGIREESTAEDCLKVLDQRGRACTPKQLIEAAREIFERTGTIEAFLAEFSKEFEFLHVEDDAITVVYPRCFCHHIADIPAEEIPDEYCECSRSWVQQLFEEATQLTVDVKILDSIIRGGESCRFAIRFP